MTNTFRHPAISRDAKAWRDATGAKLTEALRQIEDPLHQGILGERIVVRDLLRVLEEDSLVGRNGSVGTFGRNGLYADIAMLDDLSDEVLREILLAAEVLRMFTHSETLAPGGTPPMTASGLRFDTSLIDLYSREWVNSYEMKHTVEQVLAGVVPYVSNGAVILAAKMIGLPIVDFDKRSANVNIGVRRDEYERLRRALDRGDRQETDHTQPSGYARLRAVLDRVKAGEPFEAELAISLDAPSMNTAFHEWLVDQAHSSGMPGRLAYEYKENVRTALHRPAESPEVLLALMDRWYSGPEFDRIAEYLVDEFRVQHPAH